MTGTLSPSLHQEETPYLPIHNPPARTSTLAAIPEGSQQPDPVLRSLRISPIPFAAARSLVVRHHYLHSFPGGTMLSLGVFLGERLLGAVTLGAGAYRAYQLVREAKPDDCLTLTRIWLSDELPRNSESRTIGLTLKALGKNTSLKFLVTYADPAAGHTGTIYQATGWLYTGLSSAMLLYDLGDGKARHSRSIAHAYGSRSLRYFASRGVAVKMVPQAPKHRYLYFLNNDWRSRLNVPVLPYPKKGVSK